MAAVTAGPGLTNTITALKNAQLAQSPVLLLGGAAPTALQGRGALQDIDQRPLIAPHVKQWRACAGCATSAPPSRTALRRAMSGVPGPVFVECPVDLLYDEALIRQWYADAAGKGTALGDRLLRWYLNRHAREDVRRRRGGGRAGASLRFDPPRADDGSARARRGGAGAGRAAVAGDRQPGAAARRPGDGARRRRHPAADPGLPLRHGARPARAATIRCRCATQRRNALREADCVLLAGVPCDFRLDYGKHVRRSRHADRRQPQRGAMRA